MVTLPVVTVPEVTVILAVLLTVALPSMLILPPVLVRVPVPTVRVLVIAAVVGAFMVTAPVTTSVRPVIVRLLAVAPPLNVSEAMGNAGLAFSVMVFPGHIVAVSAVLVEPGEAPPDPAPPQLAVDQVLLAVQLAVLLVK